MSTTKKYKEFRATKRLCDDIALVIEKEGDGGLFMALSTAELEQSTAIKRLKSIPQIAAAIRDRKAVLDARKPAPAPPKPSRKISFRPDFFRLSERIILPADEVAVYRTKDGLVRKPIGETKSIDFMACLGNGEAIWSAQSRVHQVGDEARPNLLRITFKREGGQVISTVLNAECLLVNHTALVKAGARHLELSFLEVEDFVFDDTRRPNWRRHHVKPHLLERERSKFHALGIAKEKGVDSAQAQIGMKSFFNQTGLFRFLDRIHAVLGPIQVVPTYSSNQHLVPAAYTAQGDELSWIGCATDDDMVGDPRNVESVIVTDVTPVEAPAKLVSINPHVGFMGYNVGGLTCFGFKTEGVPIWNKLIGAV